MASDERGLGCVAAKVTVHDNLYTAEHEFDAPAGESMLAVPLTRDIIGIGDGLGIEVPCACSLKRIESGGHVLFGNEFGMALHALQRPVTSRGNTPWLRTLCRGFVFRRKTGILITVKLEHAARVTVHVHGQVKARQAK
jgi:hypothetical protein